MRLLKLYLHGFKTFADRTEIEFGEGLTAVVGPNGCGKSNIADAILWVLGEQNPRLLRGSESRDVIFAGTATRKPLGMAEVRLTIDNRDHALPIGYDEVCVARKVYRSGESQYSLNGSACRLKDIVELFLDTGLGRGAYSFVSQSDVDAVLSARPEERRLLFEEAAGINKYRVKKKEALRRLEHAEAHLTRVRDILRELEIQRSPLADQAKVAERYLGLVERLRQIEVGLLISELKQTDYELYAARREQELDYQAIRDHDRRLAELERSAEQAGRQLANAEQELDTARLSLQSALTAVERAESRQQLLEERIRLGDRSLEALNDELKQLAGLIGEHERTLSMLNRETARLQGQLADAREQLDLQETEERCLADALREARDTAWASQEAARRRAEERVRLESALEGLRLRVAELEAVCKERAQRTRERQQMLSDASAQEKVLEERLTLSQSTLAAVQQQEAQAASALSAAESALEALNGRRQDLLRRCTEVESRLKALQEIHESGEGYYQGVRAVLAASRRGYLPPVYRPLVDLLTVPEPYRIAVEVALGSAAQDIVCDTEEQAQAAIEWLKTHRAGRATFLPLASLRPPPPLDPHSGRGLTGLVGRAMDLVTYAEQHAPAVSLALGRILVARDMAAALAAFRTVRGWSRIVTLEGEVLAPSGSLTGGSLSGRAAHLVGRKGEIDDLTAQAHCLHTELQDIEALVNRQAAGLSGLREDVAAANRALLSARAEAQTVQTELHTLQQGLARLRDEAEEMARLSAEAESRLVSLRTEAAELENTLENMSSAPHKEEVGTDAGADVEALAQSLDQVRAQRMDTRIMVERIDEQMRAMDSRCQAVQRDREAAENARSAKQARRDSLAIESQEASAELQALADKLSHARGHVQECQAAVERWRDSRQALLQQSFDLSEDIKEVSRRRAELTEELHAAELSIARLEVRLAQLAERLSAEYGITLEEALASDDPGEIGRDTANEVARLRREIRQMGDVNTGAVEEYQRITQRVEFLTEQEADLCSARESLLQTIAEIDQSTRGLFMETFVAVRSEFNRLFQRLFGGGSTELILTKPDDLLETGIEVIAQPPGKRPQSLSLLSGGERALTAAALLMSFMVVRPSPFVLLDEIDAPLDGPNVEKFVELLSEFSADTQIVIITHNPTTMEAAPRWYGVTMQEAGVSSVLVYRVPQVQGAKPDDRVAAGALPDEGSGHS